MQRSFARTSLGHSMLTKVVQSISRCTNTLALNSSSRNMNLYHWCWPTKYSIIFIAIKTTFATPQKKIFLFTRLWLGSSNAVYCLRDEFRNSWWQLTWPQLELPGKNYCGLSGFLFWDGSCESIHWTVFILSELIQEDQYQHFLECTTWMEMVWLTRTKWQRLCRWANNCWDLCWKCMLFLILDKKD